MPLIVWIAAALVTVGAAAIQGTVGVGFAMVSVPVLALIDPELAPAPQLLMAFPLTIAMAWRERSSIDLSGVGWILVGRIPGAFVGVWLLAIATGQTLDILIAIAVLGAVFVIGSGRRLERTTTTKFLAGATSGTTGVVSSIGGPPIALIYSRDEAATIRSTLALIFAFGVVTSMAFRAFSGNMTLNDVRTALTLLPAVGIGLVIATRVRDRVPRRTVRITILVVCAAAAIALLFRGLVGG